MQRNLDMMIESILNVQRGVLQLQIVSPNFLMETLRKSIPSFPKDTLAPFTLSKDSTSSLTRICDIHIYIKMVYLDVTDIPLANRGTFTVFHLIPLPTALDKDKFVYILKQKIEYCTLIKQDNIIFQQRESNEATAYQQNQVYAFVNKSSLC
jgi:hypothetical protein